MEQQDFIAELTYNSTEEGGRTLPACSGYRPAVKFEFSNYLTSGQQTFIGKATVNPGETVTAYIKIVAIEVFKGTLLEGMEFEFSEGPRVIGKGRIIEMVNPVLKKVSN
ncbi:MAG: hypothetical protein ACTHLE_25080 [Agriterribacter sp.]